MDIKVEVSARHIHISQEHLEVLFGVGYTLNKDKNLSQPGQFSSQERVEIKGPRGAISNVVILGPCRNFTQVELSLTDCIKLGIRGKIRESGNLEGTDGCILIGPKGNINLNQGVIVAKRHIHMNPQEAKFFGVKDGDMGKVRIVSKCRSLTFEDVVLRVNSSFSLAMHIDTDEANAVGYKLGMTGELIQ